MHGVTGVYECMDDAERGSDHIILAVNPEHFGLNGCSDAQLYKCIKIAELTPTTVSGSIIRLLLESDTTVCILETARRQSHLLV